MAYGSPKLGVGPGAEAYEAGLPLRANPNPIYLDAARRQWNAEWIEASMAAAQKRNQVNVLTIEDPPEYVIADAAHLPVTNAATDEERNEKFRAAISAALRSDPDIIMIGDILDKNSGGPDL